MIMGVRNTLIDVVSDELEERDNRRSQYTLSPSDTPHLELTSQWMGNPSGINLKARVLKGA